MAELEIDQSNLPRVQEVCQCFAVLEDGVLAHSLQEQEIEKYYTTNIQKNQLVQNDIRVAKMLQHEEEEQGAQERTLHRQTSRQLEEQDSEYARLIQEEIQRCAEEEAHRREREDEEIAKRIQEEEEQRTRRRSRGHDSFSDGAAVQCLDLVELQQVLRDEELARRLQDEEDRLVVLRRSPQPSSSSRSSYPEGDFRVAQVAQDEEIARFMQKREMTSKRRSRDVEGPVSWREDREMSSSHYDRRASRETQGQRERLDSEGLPSPTEDYSPETQPPSPVSSTPQVQHIRNIAEELDPTFKARTQNKDSLRVEQTGPPYQSLPLPHSGLPDFTEEPTFIPPTKRPSDKSARSSKAKEKKENCKQQ